MSFPPIGALLDWLLPPACPLCARPARTRTQPCEACQSRLRLPREGLAGTAPLPWWAAGAYEGELRRALLGLRRRPRPAALQALAVTIRPPLVARPPGVPPLRPLLVVVPSWKRQANPLPPLLARCLTEQLGLERGELLKRSHPVLGQHHLGRALRFANQRGSFACCRQAGAGEARRRPLLLVDDILTSGATALAAAEALRQGGWQVHGLLCLARTPAGRGGS